MTGMKQITIFLIAVFFSLACFADTVFVHSTIVIPDSVLVKSLTVGANKDSFWDKNSSALIAAFVSLFAIGLTLWTTDRNLKSSRENLHMQLKASNDNLGKQLKAQNDNFAKQLEVQDENLARQLKAQLITTIVKQEIEIIRGCTAKCIENYVEIEGLRLTPKYKDKNIHDLPEYIKFITEFRNNHIMLNLYLNFKEPLEKELSNLVLELWGVCNLNNKDIRRKTQIIDDIQSVSHLIFEKKSGLV
jgi:hypothetical protein